MRLSRVLITRWQKNGTFESSPISTPYYDLKDDWPLIVASFAEQYSIRLDVEDITWPEYCHLFQGLSSETPIGKIVAIRSEKDRKVIKSWPYEVRKIRTEWIAKQQSDDRIGNKQKQAWTKVFQSLKGK